MNLKERILADMKAAMKAKDKQRLGAIRLIQAAIKQREVDERVALEDAQVIAVLDKMIKQRRESIRQYEQAGRQDLAAREAYELRICQAYLPEAMGEEEIQAHIAAAIVETGATTLRDMGRVMGVLKPKLQGRADLSKVSEQVKQQLSSGQ